MRCSCVAYVRAYVRTPYGAVPDGADPWFLRALRTPGIFRVRFNEFLDWCAQGIILQKLILFSSQSVVPRLVYVCSFAVDESTRHFEIWEHQDAFLTQRWSWPSAEMLWIYYKQSSRGKPIIQGPRDLRSYSTLSSLQFRLDSQPCRRVLV